MENIAEEVSYGLVVHIDSWSAKHTTADRYVAAFRSPIHQWRIAIVVRREHLRCHVLCNCRWHDVARYSWITIRIGCGWIGWISVRRINAAGRIVHGRGRSCGHRCARTLKPARQTRVIGNGCMGVGHFHLPRWTCYKRFARCVAWSSRRCCIIGVSHVGHGSRA